MQRGQTLEALILKWQRVGEADRLVTLVCQEYGKIQAVAKNARAAKSTNSANLETGNLVKVLFTTTKTWPIISQSQAVQSSETVRGSLPKLKRLLAYLEILDVMLVNEELQPETYEELKLVYQQILTNASTTRLQLALDNLLASLGYARLAQTKHESISAHVAEIIQRELRSHRFLSSSHS